MEVKKIEKKMTQYVVIGLGRFGRSVATTLASLGNEVLAIDTRVENVKQVENLVSGAVVADATAAGVLESLGVQNFDCVINCIGDNLEASVLTTFICKDLGISYIVAKAQNDQHKKVLERIGADMVVFPEAYMGKKVANMLSNPSMNEVMTLSDKVKIFEIAMPEMWQDKSIGEMNIRNKYKITIIYVKREDEVISPEPETELKKGDILVVAGDVSKIESLTNKTSEVIDATHSLQDALSD